ncbi:hypothetical protein PYW07_009596 [Mythimna separata]|uniref:Uncharacterized protein n=1 Tax=Mythimna separata TaxID=271217 RepID=A0AAD7YCL3_MYTSE|nr:hypothetical protein PYW07_009596 [Mythimna separata]
MYYHTALLWARLLEIKSKRGNANLNFEEQEFLKSMLPHEYNIPQPVYLFLKGIGEVNYATERSPVSAGPSTPRRHRVRQRRLRQTPFDRATSEFVAIEESRLRLERERETRQHNLEMEQLRIEAQRVQVEAERVRVEEARMRLETDLRA